MTKVVKVILIAVIAVVLLFGLLLGVMVGFGIYGWKHALRAGNEAAAVQHLKTIEAVELQYYKTHKRNFGTFDQLVADELLAKRFSGATPIVDGYVFTLRLTAASSGQSASFTVNADPQASDTGTHHFYMSSTDGTIRVNKDRPAGPADSPL
jgi:hypothetical protein